MKSCLRRWGRKAAAMCDLAPADRQHALQRIWGQVGPQQQASQLCMAVLLHADDSRCVRSTSGSAAGGRAGSAGTCLVGSGGAGPLFRAPAGLGAERGPAKLLPACIEEASCVRAVKGG